MTKHERALVAALRQLLQAYAMVLPGIRYIAVADYALINDAPIAAEKAIRDATSRPTPAR